MSQIREKLACDYRWNGTGIRKKGTTMKKVKFKTKEKALRYISNDPVIAQKQKEYIETMHKEGLKISKNTLDNIAYWMMISEAMQPKK
jgi:hypothetical protein